MKNFKTLKLNEELSCNIASVVFSGFWRRFFALILDYAFIIFFILVLGNFLNMLGFKISENNEMFVSAEISQKIESLENNAEKNIYIGQEKMEVQNTSSLDSNTKFAHESESIIKHRKTFNIIVILIEISYFTFFVASKKQATIGQRIMNIMVVSRSRGEMTLLHSLIRYIFMQISILLYGLGFATIPFSKEKAALHDFICNTRVIVLNRKCQKKENEITKETKVDKIAKNPVKNSKKVVKSSSQSKTIKSSKGKEK
jgi:uncharacterized RDD family membrane protein YckC